MYKVYIEYSNPQYQRMYLRNGFKVVNTLEEADFVQFTGGADVSPALYGQHLHPRTANDPDRDKQEMEVFSICVHERIPMVGICRGGQFLNVMSGGSMKQHSDGHAGGMHLLVDVATGEMIEVTSTHHQVMQASADATLIACASESTFYESMTDIQDGEPSVIHMKSERGDDTEVLWYEDTKCLCFQPHPEYVSKEHPCQGYFFELLNQYIIPIVSKRRAA